MATAEQIGTPERPAAVVIGLDNFTGIQTARVLASRHIPVVAVTRDRRSPYCRTNVCHRIVVADSTDEAVVEALEALGPAFAARPVLFPCTDLSVLTIARSRERLDVWYRAALPPLPVVEILLDKGRFHEYALGAGLPVPPAYVLRNRSEAEAAAAMLKFPCVLKPAVRTMTWQRHSKAKVFKADGPSQFLAHYERCHAWTEVLVAQEWVQGPDGAHLTCNAYFDAQSKPAVTFVSRKLRQWPLEGGVGCLSEECRDETILHETVRLFQGLGHHGLAYLEMKRHPGTGRAVIIEPNVGRPTGRSAAADAAGVDLLYTQYCDAVGWPLPPRRAQTYRSRKWVYFRRDCQSAFVHWRRGELTPREWLRSLRGCRDALFSWEDPGPFLADLGSAAARLVRGRRRHPDSAAPPPEAQQTAKAIDYDIHGIVGLRLIDASPADAATVARQLGPLTRALTREPDIVVRFVDELPIRGLRFVELGRTGYTDDGFLILHSRRRHARVRIPFEQLGGRCEIVCQRGLRAIPLLMSIVALTALKRGSVPLHASAFVHDDTGVLVSGWAKGGKTSALLAFARRGATYVGDEWILLAGDGGRMHGIPEFIRLQDWHLHHLPWLREQVRVPRRLFFRLVRGLDRLYKLSGASRVGTIALLGDGIQALRRRLNVQLDPLKIFAAHVGTFTASPERVFFLVTHDEPAIRVERADIKQIASRMASSLWYEQLPLLEAYLAYQCAFPGRRNEFLEYAQELEAELIERALAGKEAYVVSHPYPCDLTELFETMAPFCGRRIEPAAMTWLQDAICP